MSEAQEKRQELRKILKKKILERVLSNDTQDSVHALVNLNKKLVRMREMRDIPDDHAQELALIREEEIQETRLMKLLSEHGISGYSVKEPRSIKQLNLLERLSGESRNKWSIRNDDELKQILALLHAPMPSGAIN